MISPHRKQNQKLDILEGNGVVNEVNTTLRKLVLLVEGSLSTFARKDYDFCCKVDCFA